MIPSTVFDLIRSKYVRILVIPEPITRITTWCDVKNLRYQDHSVAFENDTGCPFGIAYTSNIYRAVVSRSDSKSLDPEWEPIYIEVNADVHAMLQGEFKAGCSLVDLIVLNTNTPAWAIKHSLEAQPYDVKHFATLRGRPNLLLRSFPTLDPLCKLSDAIRSKPVPFVRPHDKYYQIKYVTSHPEIYDKWLNDFGLVKE
jgi:hypothetical protein